MKVKWRNLPAIITLLAGFITCVITIVCQYPLNKMLWVLIVVMAVFFTLGLIIRAVIMHFVERKDPDDKKAEEEENEEENADGEATEDKDGETSQDKTEEQPADN